MTPYYERDGITIYHAHAMEMWPQLPPVSLVLMDPPYGINYRSRHNSSWRQKGSRWERWDRYRRDANFPGIVGDDSPFDPSPWLALEVPLATFGANYYADRLPPSRCWVTWDKRVDITPNNQADSELVWTNFNKPCRIFRHRWSGIIRDGEENVSRAHKHHPHQKPAALLRWIIGYSDTDGLVLDPFMGSGSTLVAARDMGRRAIGIEIEERYCEIAANRLAQMVLPFKEA